MKLSVWAKVVSGLFELILAIPIIGGLIVIGNGYLPLTIVFFLHLTTLIICVAAKHSFKSSVLGMITSLIAWIPVVGWIFHGLTSIALFVSAYQTRKKISTSSSIQ
jgi:hypothetical protein